MSIYSDSSGDSIVDSCLDSIRYSRFGESARIPMANAVMRCYDIAISKAGGTSGVPRSSITEHTNRIKNAVFGEEVRDALKTVLTLCYAARGISVNSSESNLLTSLIDAQTGEDLKNYILMTITKCCRDVRA